jgi:hypothetical protein
MLMRQASRAARGARQSSRCAGSTARQSSSSTTTHFGDRTVPTEEKAGLVKGVFSSVANNYDLMNDLMSGGLISASRCVEAPSRHRRASSPGEGVVGGLFFDFEAVRTASSDRDAPRGHAPALEGRLRGATEPTRNS